ncbi:MAG: hypothetical protein L6Q98_17035 [Anaerolineae bacterium]|nr:hypothetical protein [Anaerolineae bacterium]NUQ05688.1 hypothetical protein [Anaerolineae bacterium]
MPHSKTAITRYLPVLMLLIIVGALGIVPASAQDDLPTDPLQRAFRVVRNALEEKYNVDLLYVLNWTFEETEFVGGIDSCLDNLDPTQARGLYYGWRFVITSLDGRQFEGRSSFDTTIVTACDKVTAAAATTTETTDSNLPAPVAGAGAVGGFELGGHALELNANTVSAMRRAGMTWVKFQYRYALGADPAAVAGLINAAKSNGFKILVAVVGSPSELGANFDSYINTFANFLGGVAALNPDAIEVWNEPNIDREWPAGQVNGANYARLLAASFNAIKSRNGNVIVISGAPAPTGYFGAAGCTAQGCNDDVFMQQMAQAGAGNYLDCVGLHYNEGIIAPSASGGDPRGGYPTYFFGSMLNRGYSPFGGKPVCFTELGYLSPEGFGTPLPGGFAWAQNTSLAEHASWLAEAAALAAQSGRVRLMIVWNVDFPLFTATDPMGGYAMIRPGGACPACDSLGTVMGR